MPTSRLHPSPLSPQAARATGAPTPGTTSARRLERVALAITSLGAGGAERVMSVMASHWAAAGTRVTLITLDAAGHDFFPLHPAVVRVGLGASGRSAGAWAAVRNNGRRVAGLRRAIRESGAEAVISFQPSMNVLALLAATGTGVPVIVAERADPTQHRVGRAWEALRRVLYPRAAAVAVQTESVARWAERFVRTTVRVIPNPVPAPSRDAPHPAPGATAREPMILAMGRLDAQKGFDLLLHAFARCRAGAPGWRLVVLGEGADRGALEALAARLGIDDAVSFPGVVSDPAPWLARAGLFVLSSRYEGFPNALLEAMAVGTPVVAADCPSGPREVVRDGVDGLLVPVGDADVLADAMRRMIGDADLRARLGARATEVRDRFAVGRVMEQWEDLVEQVGVRRRPGARAAAPRAARVPAGAPGLEDVRP